MQAKKGDYKNSITWSQFWSTLLLFAVSYFLFIIFLAQINNYIIDGFFAFFPKNTASNILWFCLVVYLIFRLSKTFKYALLPTLQSLYFALLASLFYFIAIRLPNNYTFYSFKSWHMDWLKYADIAWVAVCVIALDFRSYKKPLAKQSFLSLIADEPDPDKISDIIENESYVQKVAKTINETACHVSYSIGIFASWGAGKTDFLLRLKKVLENNKDENIVVQFNPWKATTTESIMDDFFTLLSNALRPYNKSVVVQLKKYSRKILSGGKEIQYRIADTLVDEMIRDASLQEKYDSINASIQRTGKRLIILIDDLDRINAPEVTQVFRIIRNSASFANTFFIVALDHEYIISVLGKTNFFAKEEQYLKKIFQLVITLPKIRKETFPDEIIRLLTYEGIPSGDKQKIENAISSLRYGAYYTLFSPNAGEEHFLEKMLDNYRDVKRFCNSFQLNFQLLKDDIETVDLVLLELLKNKSFTFYAKIADRTLLTIEKSGIDNVYKLNEQAWKEFEEHSKKEHSKMDSHSLLSLKATIVKLLEKNDFKGHRSFLYPYNFRLYFCYALFNLISLRSFQDTIELPWREIRRVFDGWVEEGKYNDLDRILDEMTEFRDVQQLQKFLKVYLADGEKKYFVGRAQNIIMDVDLNVKNYFPDKNTYADFARIILSDNDLAPYHRSLIANKLLSASISNADFLLPETELQERILNLFDIYLSTHKGYNQEVHDFYMLNDDSRGAGSRITISKHASKKLEVYLAVTDNFEGYLKYCIYTYSQPNDGTFVLEPFTIDIFGDWQTFYNRVAIHNSSNETIGRLRIIIMQAVDGFMGGKTAFRLEGQEKDFVLSHLRSMGRIR